MGARSAVTLRDVHVVRLRISVDQVVDAATVRMFQVSSTSVTETSDDIEWVELEEDDNVRQLYHSELECGHERTSWICNDCIVCIVRGRLESIII